MHDALLVQKLDAVEDWQKSIEDFGLLERKGGVCPSAILELSLQVGYSARIQQPIIVYNWSEEERVGDVLMQLRTLSRLHIEVGLL